MKKWLLLIFVLAVFFLFGCADHIADPKESSSSHQSSATTEASTESPSTEPATEATEPVTSEPSTEEATEPVTEAPTAAPEIPSYSFEERNETVYTTDNLNIRKGPSTEAEVITVLAPASALTRIGYHEEWSKVEFDGQIAYAASAYLSTTAPSFSNKSISYGYNRNTRDANNVPGLMDYYTRNWGQYADFIQDTSQKVIYLTMDEGYENGFTPMILDVLKEKKVPCVFFLTEDFVDSQPQLVQRMIDEGHILGNHTCSHPAKGMPSLSTDAQKADIMRLHNKVLDQFGYDMKLFRFPAGIYSDESLNVVSSLGYRSVFWSFAYRDFELANQPERTAALNQCLGELHPGAIYLLHAVSETNAHILGAFIDGVRAAGYTFGTYPIN